VGTGDGLRVGTSLVSVSSGSVSSSRGGGPVRRRPPGWRQWALALGGAAVFIVALIVFVNREDATANQPAGVTTPAAIAEQNREARIVVGEDQAPHVMRLRGHGPPAGVGLAAGALRDAVVAYMRRQVASGAIAGPVMRSGCTPSGASGSRRAFHCVVEAGNVNYPFLGVVDLASRQVTYCKRDAPPVPSMNIPVSRRCT
jgi:hypothetical protein